MEIVLIKPIKFGEETITMLKLREPVGRDFRGLDATNPFTMMLDLAAVLSGVPASAIDQLSAADTMVVCEKVGSFLPASQATGAS